jgi:hypothetical protein
MGDLDDAASFNVLLSKLEMAASYSVGCTAPSAVGIGGEAAALPTTVPDVSTAGVNSVVC